jgi:hypothetical protein
LVHFNQPGLRSLVQENVEAQDLEAEVGLEILGLCGASHVRDWLVAGDEGFYH